MQIKRVQAASVPVVHDDNGKPMDPHKGLKALRNRLNIPMRVVAAGCGISISTCNAWERGGVSPERLIPALEFMEREIERRVEAAKNGAI